MSPNSPPKSSWVFNPTHSYNCPNNGPTPVEYVTNSHLWVLHVVVRLESGVTWTVFRDLVTELPDPNETDEA